MSKKQKLREKKTMKSLNLGVKKVRLAIDGDENRIFEFTPSDSAIRSKFAGFCKTLEEIQGRLNNLDAEKFSNEKQENEIISARERYEAEIEKEIESDLRKQFDNTFGTASCDIIFGEVGILTPNSNGEPVIVTVINALMPYFTEESKKYTEKYTKGLK